MTTTINEASRYQQLRDHLNYLRLPDAAAALPTVLDQAKTEKLSPTATLERLFRIEVQATEARRLTGRLRFASLPSPANRVSTRPSSGTWHPTATSSRRPTSC